MQPVLTPDSWPCCSASTNHVHMAFWGHLCGQKKNDTDPNGLNMFEPNWNSLNCRLHSCGTQVSSPEDLLFLFIFLILVCLFVCFLWNTASVSRQTVKWRSRAAKGMGCHLLVPGCRTPGRSFPSGARFPLLCAMGEAPVWWIFMKTRPDG